MAQALFDALAGMTGMDSQTAMAVQSLLESQAVAEQPPPVAASLDDDDLFQCGKCKKQFTSLPVFVSHKQTACAAQPQLCTTLGTSLGTSVTSHCATFTAPTISLGKQVVTGGNANVISVPSVVPSSVSPLPLGGGMVLTDDLMTFAGIEQAVATSTLQMVQGASIQGNPFLSQPPLTPGVRGSTPPPPSSLPPYAPTYTYPSSAAADALPMQVTTNLAPQQPHQSVQPVEVSMAIPVVKSNSVKGGRNNSSVITVITDLDTNTVMHQRRPKQESGVAMLEDDAGGGGDAKRKLKCQYCDKTFAKNFDLQQHVRSHTGEKPFQCIVCGRAFAQKSNVKKHMQTHKVWPKGTSHTLPDQPLPELVVTPTTQGEAHALNGMEVQLNNAETGVNNRIQLSVGDAVASPEERDSSIQIVVDNTYMCQYCSEKFKSYFNLKSHMTIHKSEQVYMCIVTGCSMTFAELDAFLEHTKTHEESMKYRCHVCNKHFPSLYELGVHQYSHSLYPNQGSKPGPKYFRCTKCNNKYATPEALQHHLQTTSHTYACPHCSKVFACERYLRRHLPTHGTIGEFRCETCFKTFKTEHYVKMHALMHSGEKPFACDQCPAAFNRKDKLKRHQLIHEPVKKYKCPFKSHTGCMKAFNRPDKLKAHIITHSGVKPYRCADCGKTFSRRPHLAEHARLHRRDYRYSCGRCQRGFLRLTLYRKHRCREDAQAETESDVKTAPPVSVVTPPAARSGGLPPRQRAPPPRLIAEDSPPVSRPKRGRPRKTVPPPSHPPARSVAPPPPPSVKDAADNTDNVIIIEPCMAMAKRDSYEDASMIEDVSSPQITTLVVSGGAGGGGGGGAGDNIITPEMINLQDATLANGGGTRQLTYVTGAGDGSVAYLTELGGRGIAYLTAEQLGGGAGVTLLTTSTTSAGDSLVTSNVHDISQNQQ